MHFGFQFVQRQAFKQEMTREGDMVRALFKETTRLLSESEYQKSLEFVASKKKMARYRDIIDFLFCELVIGYKKHCFAFYEDEAPPLRELPVATPEQLAEWDIFLAASLHIAHEALEQHRRMTWAQFRNATLQALQMTG